MKLWKKVIEEKNVLSSIKCDVCLHEYDDIFEIQEFLSWENHCGYGSVFGDGEIITIDICQKCQKEMLGNFIKRHGNYINGTY